MLRNTLYAETHLLWSIKSSVSLAHYSTHCLLCQVVTLLKENFEQVQSNQKHPRFKKRSGQELKQALLKKMGNQMGGQCLLVLIGLKVLVIMNSLENIVISGAQGLLMLIGSKFLIKMTRLQNIKIK